jgi:hypothetical protein
VSSRNGKEKEVSSGLFGPKKKLYSVCELNWRADGKGSNSFGKAAGKYDG